MMVYCSLWSATYFSQSHVFSHHHSGSFAAFLLLMWPVWLHDQDQEISYGCWRILLNHPASHFYVSCRHKHACPWTSFRESDTPRHCCSWIYHIGGLDRLYPGFPNSTWGLALSQEWGPWWSLSFQGSGQHYIQARYGLPWCGAGPYRPVEPPNTSNKLEVQHYVLHSFCPIVLINFGHLSGSHWC